MKAYLDNGATTKVAEEVLDAMKPFFLDNFGNASSLHEWGRQARQAVEDSRKIIAQAINALPEEIIFTSGGTESDNMALRGVAQANSHKGRHIITSSIEHHAVDMTCRQLEKEGFDITYLEVTQDGFVRPEDVERAMRKDTILVSIMHANNEIGTIQPIEEIGRICAEKGVYFHTDAVQSLTKAPIDVRTMHIDLASFSAHKIHGPKGIGALYMKKGTRCTPLLTGGAQESKTRPGTENVPGIVGFARAVGMAAPSESTKMTALRDRLMEGLLKIPHTKLNGSRGQRLCNNVNITFLFIEGEGLLMHLDMVGIAVSTGSACSSESLEPSHVLLAIGLEPEIAHGSIRFTLSKYTAEAEIDYAIEKVTEAVTKLREMSPWKPGEVFEYTDEH